MKELNIMEATVLTSPNPLTLICSKKEDGSTNLAPICFVSYPNDDALNLIQTATADASLPF